MKLLDYTICLPSLTTPVTIIPFGCVHGDDPGFHEGLFEQCISEIEKTPDCYAIGLGDYWNFLRTTARKHLKSYIGDEDSWRDMDHMVRKKAEEFYGKYLKRIRHKLIGLAEGNHFYEFSSGGTDTQYLCQLAEVPYLDKPAFIRLNVEVHKRTLKVFKILVHHGDWSGGYTRIGGDVNSVEMKALGFDFDIYLFSHTHRKFGLHVPSLSISTTGELRIIERPRAFVRTGCFMRGYVENCAGRYVDKKLLSPSDIGYVRLSIHFSRPYSKTRYRAQAEKLGHRPSSGVAGPMSYKFEVSF